MTGDRLPEGWVVADLQTLAGPGGVLCDGDWVESKDQDPDGEVRLIQLADVGDGVYLDKSARSLNLETARRLRCTFLQSGDVLIARMPDPLGRACVFPGDARMAVTVVDVCIFRACEGRVSHRWLRGALNAPQFRAKVAELESGSTRKRISRKNLASIEIPVPPLAEQRRIVEKLEELFSQLDAGVAALERVRANLKRYRASVLKAAVEGRLTEEWRRAHPDAEPAAELLKRIRKERREAWERNELAKYEAKGKPSPKNWREKYKEPEPPDTTDLPELPEGWCWARLGEVCTVLSGYGFPRELQGRACGAVPFFKVGDISAAWRAGQRVLREAEHYITESEAQGLGARVLPAGTVVFAKIGAAIALNRRAMLGQGSLVDNNVMGLAPGASVDPVYLYYYMCTQRLGELTRGGVVPSLRRSDVSPLVLPLPPLSEQAAIVAEVEARLSVLDALEAMVEANLARAGRLRQAILKRAFEGRLVPQECGTDAADAGRG